MTINFNEFVRSKKFTRVALGIGVLVLVLVIFQLGVFIGFHRAGFSYHMGDNYYRAFEERDESILRTGGMGGRGFTNAHGATGKIIKIALPTIIVESPDLVEKIILTNDDTEFRSSIGATTAQDLKLNDAIIVIGSPNDDGEIVARLIRILPTPPGYEKMIESATGTIPAIEGSAAN
ncbi:MAG: hypothetical protein UY04_C0033G0011 [Parcubacteria group bacterium GW2011_GWA2_47_7]|nr:MAG: hypothetical protein UY04_C0033G0011 [Parcubacteria group bacterium GW2011_GWA2_47_7]